MRKFLLLLVLSAFCFSAISQSEKVLNDFKYRIDHFRAISISAHGGTNYSKNELGAATIKNQSSAGNFFVGLTTIKSTDKILLFTSGGVSSSATFNKNTNTTDNIKARAFSSLLQFDLSNKWFSSQRFIEFGTSLAANFNAAKNSNKNTPGLYKNRQKSYALSITGGVGKGRLENITDMQNALWLNNALKETGRLSKELANDELIQLGRSITKGNNTRILDLRKRTQFILETVDNYLQQNGFVNKTDITYFSNLNDILFFAFNNSRLAGTEKFIRITPSVSGTNLSENRDNINPTSKYEQEPIIKSAIVTAGINKYKPVNLKYQNNYGVGLKLGYTDYKKTDKFFTSGILVNDIKTNTTIKQAGINLYFQHSVYPNTRTVLNFSFQSETGYQDDGKKAFYGTGNLSASLNYFISYRTRFISNAGILYNKNTYYTYQNLQLLANNLQAFVNAGIEINL